MKTRLVQRWTIEETPATATAPRQVWLRAVWDELPVSWAGEATDEPIRWDALDRKPVPVTL